MTEQIGEPAAGGAGPELRGDCARCFALCCVAPSFSASADFAVDKAAGVPCVHQRADFRCDIHPTLVERGFTGCTLYDCFGAGQHVAQGTFGGRDWRAHPETAESMFAVFAVMRDLHELLWYLTQARALAPARPLRAELDAAAARIRRRTDGSAGDLLAVDVQAVRGEAGALLARAGDLVRSAVLDALAPGGPHTGPELERMTGLTADALRPILVRLERAGRVTRTSAETYALAAH